MFYQKYASRILGSWSCTWRKRTFVQTLFSIRTMQHVFLDQNVVHRIVCINTHSSCRRRTVLGFFQRTCPVEFIDRWLQIWITCCHTARADSSQLNSGDSETFRTATTGGFSVELIRVGLGSVIKLGLTISWIQSN
jgi:hypothetical protein